MTKLRLFGLVLGRCSVASCLAVCCVAYGQIYYPNQEIRIHDLPSLTASSGNLSDVLATSVEIILRDKEVCCGKNSALEDSLQSADPASLDDVAKKLQGRHLLSDGRPVMVTAQFVPAAAVNSGLLIYALTEKHPALMEWDSHLYVVYGVTFNRTIMQNNGPTMDTIQQFLLVDTRFSDKRREVTFDRQTDDWGKVPGLLMLKVARQ
ncbi:MAG TPA: hypothetical protein VNX26_14440 [Candidatus Acidoferrum sp.]|jgi:hypothetical protein|nr:hypothetical protein [Candidatus Acidoferrum sp.]